MEADLHNVIKKGTILKDVHKQYIMCQLFRAIRFLHSGNVLHRCVRFSFILLRTFLFFLNSVKFFSILAQFSKFFYKSNVLILDTNDAIVTFVFSRSQTVSFSSQALKYSVIKIVDRVILTRLPCLRFRLRNILIR